MNSFTSRVTAFLGKGDEVMDSEVALSSVFLLPPPFQNQLRDADGNIRDSNWWWGRSRYLCLSFFFSVMVLSAIVCEVKRSSGIEFESAIWLYQRMLNWQEETVLQTISKVERRSSMEGWLYQRLGQDGGFCERSQAKWGLEIAGEQSILMLKDHEDWRLAKVDCCCDLHLIELVMPCGPSARYVSTYVSQTHTLKVQFVPLA